VFKRGFIKLMASLKTICQNLHRYREDIWEYFIFLIGVQAITFIVGILAPVMTLRKRVTGSDVVDQTDSPVIKWIVKLAAKDKTILNEENTSSILGGIWHLLTNNEILIGLLILFFSILFPISKMALLVYAWLVRNKTKTAKIIQHIELVGKWAFLDVLVVAILVCVVKLGKLATVEVRYGLYFFILSVLLGWFSSFLTAKTLHTNH